MTREEARKAAEVMLVYADGKEIEWRSKSSGCWESITTPSFGWDETDYRIKPEPKYRPFKNAEECWQEMQKHQPFGWVKEISNEEYINLGWVPTEDNEDTFHNITFADGTPFGVKEE